MLPYYFTFLAEVYTKTGQINQGLRGLAEARATMDRSGERWWEAELYRLKGELLRQQADGVTLKPTRTNSAPLEVDAGGPHGRGALHAEAETCFRQALKVANQQQARSLELRAAMSLSRLWQQQGKCDEARHLLAEVYGWFTEGFDTGDLREAKLLLEELSSRAS